MERLTERHKYNGKEHVSVDRKKYGISCSNFCSNCGKADCDDVRKALFKLAEYEDLEEQGKLLKLPVAVGDMVYVLAECENIPTQLDGTLYGENGEPGTATGYYCTYEDNCPFDDEEFEGCEKYQNKTAVFEDTVSAITIDECGVWINTDKCGICGQIGDCVFLTRPDAEQALKEMEGKNGNGN